MKKALISPLEAIERGVRIADVANTDFPIAEPFYWVDCPDDMNASTHYFDEATSAFVEIPEVVEVPVELTQAELIDTYEKALDNHLDSVAKADRWDSRFTFAARAAYPNPWQQQAIAFGTWMDTCNVQAFALLQEVLAGETELPSIEDFIAGLPVFESP
jgi:hypothetical protein